MQPVTWGILFLNLKQPSLLKLEYFLNGQAYWLVTLKNTVGYTPKCHL
jgi:hypothetical protein